MVLVRWWSQSTSCILCGGGSLGQSDGEGGATSRFTSYLNGPTVAFHDVPSAGQANSCTRDNSNDVRPTFEALENAIDIGRRDTETLIVNSDYGSFAPLVS